MEEIESNSAGMDKDLDDLKETEQDREFEKFKKLTDHEPHQVIRYNHGGKPLWVTKKGKLGHKNEHLIPKCENCGAKRIFEFQVYKSSTFRET